MPEDYLGLTRITKIRNYRIFREFTWSAELPALGKYNVFYGWNGTGKTALSSLLAHIEHHSPIDEGEVEFEFSDGRKVRGQELDKQTIPALRVFNRDFVEDTVRDFDGGLSPIYYVGRQSVEARAKLEQLRADLEETIGSAGEFRKALQSAENDCDSFLTERARQVKEATATTEPSRYTNYDRRAFRSALLDMTTQTRDQALLSSHEMERFRVQKNATPKRAVESIAETPSNAAATRDATRQLLSYVVRSQLLPELMDDQEVAAWVQQGIPLHSGDRLSQTCRYCLQPLTEDRRTTIAAHFNAELTSFQARLTTDENQLRRAAAHLAQVHFPESSGLYEDMADSYVTAVGNAKQALASESSYLERLAEALADKARHPFVPVALPPGLETVPNPQDRDDALRLVNTAIKDHNARTAAFAEGVSKACRAIELALVAEAYDEYHRKVDAISAAKSKLGLAEAEATRVSQKIADQEQTLIEHARPAAELNQELNDYLGHGELRVEFKEAGYAITRHGAPATHLSEGEKTAIALLYFLKSLQDKEFVMGKGTVVIDDPVSSLDDGALFTAFGYIKTKISSANQIVVLTHNFSFFRQMQDWMRYLSNPRFYMTSCVVANGQRSASIRRLDPLLETYTSEYHYLFATIYRASRNIALTSDGSLEQYYNIPNVARRLLEYFLAFRYPDSQKTLYAQLAKVEFEESRKTRVRRLIDSFSHADDMIDEKHNPTLLLETPVILCDILDMMRLTDPGHYEAMVRLCSAPGMGD